MITAEADWSYHLIIIISLKWQNKWYPQIFILFISLFPNCSSLTHSQSIHGKWNEFVRQFVRRPSHKSREKTKSKKIQNWILVCACLFSDNEPLVVWWWCFSKTLDSRREWQNDDDFQLCIVFQTRSNKRQKQHCGTSLDFAYKGHQWETTTIIDLTTFASVSRFSAT